MGKRSDFPRVPRDFYPTPISPVHDLSPHLVDVKGFGEPCVGDGRLAEHLKTLGHDCRFASDMQPTGAAEEYALTLLVEEITEAHAEGITHWITNPPWPAKFQRGEPTLSIIRHLSAIRPTWLLLSADFKHNVYAGEVLAYCAAIVSVGRVKWIEDTNNTGKDNAAWYLFDQKRPGLPTFHPRRVRSTPIFSTEIEGLL